MDIEKDIEKSILLNEKKRMRKAVALEKRLFKVIKRESPGCYKKDFVRDALTSLYSKLKF